MIAFSKKKQNKNVILFEIPLLIESKLMKFFDATVLVIAPKKLRIKRYLKNGGDRRMFNLLDKNQMPQRKKLNYCDYLIVNNNSKNVLKKRITDIIRD